jgi:hypothetical protein
MHRVGGERGNEVRECEREIQRRKSKWSEKGEKGSKGGCG